MRWRRNGFGHHNIWALRIVCTNFNVYSTTLHLYKSSFYSLMKIITVICTQANPKNLAPHSRFHSLRGRKNSECPLVISLSIGNDFLVHEQVTIIFIVSVCLSVCLFVCLFVCAEFFSAVFDPISIKLGHTPVIITPRI